MCFGKYRNFHLQKHKLIHRKQRNLIFRCFFYILKIKLNDYLFARNLIQLFSFLLCYLFLRINSIFNQKKSVFLRFPVRKFCRGVLLLSKIESIPFTTHRSSRESKSSTKTQLYYNQAESGADGEKFNIYSIIFASILFIQVKN